MTASRRTFGFLPLSWFYQAGRATAVGRAFSRFWAWWASLGLPPRRQVGLEVKGRRTGRPRTLAVVVAKLEGEAYLVSMVGDGEWVKNVRAAGGDAYLIGGRRRKVHLEEVPVERRAPIVKEYVRVAPGGRPHIGLAPTASLADFAREASHYPVFRIRDQDTPTPPAGGSRPLPPRPRLWFRLGIPAGNVLQALGCVTGALLLRRATRPAMPGVTRVVQMIFGWLALYICSHASAHYLMGRAVGIRFVGYGVRGSDHPEDSPPGLRELTRVLPFFTVITDKPSLRAASPLARALMFSAGETSSTVCSLLAAGYAWRRRVPGGAAFFGVLLIWMLVATIVTAIAPRGDYAKALATFRDRSQGAVT
jgi:deazaflavin-dependent oxidoreductase (nitroreductase family)